MSMDVYRALANFSADNHASSALDLKKGELFEVVDGEEEREQHEWWGVRRLEDNAVGFAPAKYLKFAQKMARDMSPDPDKDEDADDMDRENEALPDLYKLPPLDVKPIEEWKPDDDDDGEGEDVPEPDYHEAELANGSSAHRPSDGSGLVGPKKLPNPVLDSKERQNLHRELLMNQKFGVDVLHRKSELKKEMERRQDVVKKKELEDYHRQKRTSFEKKLEEQASKLKLTDDPGQKSIQEEPKREQAEFLRVHSKISRAKSDNVS